VFKENSLVNEATLGPSSLTSVEPETWFSFHTSRVPGQLESGDSFLEGFQVTQATDKGKAQRASGLSAWLV
jgi:hypothetical protein